MKELAAPQVYRLPQPGPFVMVSTRDNGKSDVMTMGFHMMIRHDPPLIGCVTGPRTTAFTRFARPVNAVSPCPDRISPKPLSMAETAPARRSMG